MRKKLPLLLMFCLGVGLANAVAQKAKDATEVDPDGHRVVFENEHVRVVEARLATGAKVSLHSHQPRLIVVLTPYRIKHVSPDGRTVVSDRRPGEVIWSDTVEHAAEVLVGTVHAVEVEIKSAQAAKAKQSP